MSRQARSAQTYAFANQQDFNEQLYLALKQAPWWMISISVHVLLFLVLSLIDTGEVEREVPVALHSSFVEPELIEDEPEDQPVEQDTPVDLTKEVETPDPDPEDVEPQDDSDLDFNENFGENQGLTNTNWEGPATNTNSQVGIGGGAGLDAFGRGGPKDGGGGRSGKVRNDAVMDALEWLKAHQSPNGQWEAAGFDRWCYGKPNEGLRPDGKGKGMYDPGVSGLAMLAYLGAGYTHRGRHPYRKTVARGLSYLKNVQDPEGCFGARAGPSYIYNHATAALAMVEAYGMTGSSVYRSSARRGIEFIGLSRNPYFAWRYGVKSGDNDTSVSGWMMMALKSAKMVNADHLSRGKAAPFSVDDNAFDGLRAWLDKMTDPDTGRVGYISRGSGPARPKELLDRFPGSKSEAMTAVGVLARVFMGEDPRKSEVVKNGATLLREMPPSWNTADGSIDMYYWYYGVLAAYQVGGQTWKAWDKALDGSVVETQRADGEYCGFKGSWDPVGPWGADGGRVYSTACMALILEVKLRYGQVFGTANAR